MIPKLRTALDLCYMCLYTVQIRMHVVVDLEALLTAGLAADAVPVRKFLGLEQIDFRSADRTFVKMCIRDRSSTKTKTCPIRTGRTGLIQ